MKAVMKWYTREEATKIVDELKDAFAARTHEDVRWYSRVHAEITHHMLQASKEMEFWKLEDDHNSGSIPCKNYHAALIDLLVLPVKDAWPDAPVHRCHTKVNPPES
jgi:hypothetical protein